MKSKRTSRRKSVKKVESQKDGGMGTSKFDLYIHEKEELKNILKSKVVNYDEILFEIQNDRDILRVYNNNIQIEKKFLDYIKNYIRSPIRIRIYGLVSTKSKTKTYTDVKKYLLEE